MLKPAWNPTTNQFEMDGDCETNYLATKDLVHQPVETTSKQWLVFRVPGTIIPNLTLDLLVGWLEKILHDGVMVMNAMVENKTITQKTNTRKLSSFGSLV